MMKSNAPAGHEYIRHVENCKVYQPKIEHIGNGASENAVYQVAGATRSDKRNKHAGKLTSDFVR